ncbi:4Fe-4S dicluster domain-containing protein [Bacteroidota bacterium]
MNEILNYISISIGLLLLIISVVFVFTSYYENEPIALRKSIFTGLLIPIPYLLIGFIVFPGKEILQPIILFVSVASVIFVFLPIRGKRPQESANPVQRIDERDVMFSRRLLVEGTERFTEYYKLNPDKKELDNKFRSKPGLLKKGSTLYDPFLFAAADASFFTVERLKDFVDGEYSNELVTVDPEHNTYFIKQWALKLGAYSVGVTELRDYHKYSYVGRGDDFGKEIDLDHKYAIAFTTEMDKRMLDSAPKGSIVMESAQQYLATGAVAVQLAEFIRKLGYPARAHIDANYRVVCPLVARDAGLGEIGRMGLLMTNELGPRVRISVVTTDIPLVLDKKKPDSSMIDFCIKCKKCAEACPSNSIPFGDRTEIDGSLRWQINSEDCFTYWCQVGTDCGRCVSVCPYSHPDNLVHNLVRFGIRNSVYFRKLALILDDYFYGVKPPVKELQDWMKSGK